MWYRLLQTLLRSMVPFLSIRYKYLFTVIHEKQTIRIKNT